MLVHLSISNLAVIQDAELSFGPGLNALTGETGAGKSIVIGALSMVLGDRARTDTVRHGVAKAEVRALFRVAATSLTAEKLRELDLLEESDSESVESTRDLVVRRIIAANGRGRVYINGVLSTVGTLALVTEGLVDISSQHQHTALLKSDRHLGLLDRFGGLVELRDAYQGAFDVLVQRRQERDDLERRERDRIEREDFVKFQLEEIQAVNPVAGELDGKTQERDRLTHADRLVKGARDAESKLTGGAKAALTSLTEAGQLVARIAQIDSELTPMAERIDNLRIEVEDVGYDLARYASGVDANPHRLQELDDRIDALRRLERKHGGSLEVVVDRAQALEAELAEFDSLEIDIREADQAVEQARASAQTAADALTKVRQGAASKMGDRVTEELRGLAMQTAEVGFKLSPAEALGPMGQDRGELLIQTNLGEPLKPLAKVASGGELSRLLLALKRALIRVDPVSTCVFDEVDTGVGGAVAEVIGHKLAGIAHGDGRQVIAITHLAQIAAFGNHHLVVVKRGDGERVATTVEVLSPEERIDEIARMLGGVEITETTRAHAEEMLRHGAAFVGDADTSTPA